MTTPTLTTTRTARYLLTGVGLLAYSLWFISYSAPVAHAAGRVFYDGFEDGTTNAWSDGGSVGYYAKCDVVTSALDGGLGPKAGTRMARCNWDGTQGLFGHRHQGLSKTVPEATEYLYRFWTRSDSDVDVADGSKLGRFQGEGYSFFDYLFTGGSNPGAFYDFEAECNAGTALSGFDTTGGWPKTQWRKWEIYIKDDNATGIVRVWVNDVLDKEAVNVDTSSLAYSWGLIYLMSNWSLNAGWEHDANNHMYWDEFEVYTNLGTGGSGLMSDGSMTQGGADITPPVLSGGSPTGTLSVGTTSTTMQVTTNENATCKYATSAGTAYASMPSTFTTTGGTTHSVTVSGLVNGGSYTRYVRCSDASSNVNTSDYTVSWTVASSGGGAGPVAMNECTNPPVGSVFCEDFDTGSTNDTQRRAKWDDYDGAMDVNFPVDTGPSQTAGNHVAQFLVASGVSGGADLVQVFSSTYDKLYTRWYVKYETGFNFNAPLHGGGLAFGSRSYLGNSGNQPSGSDFAYFNIQHQNGTPFHNALYAYSYYPGMYQDCGGPGSCYGDSLPCVYDNGSNYCTNAAHRPQGTPPSITDGAWYCVESMVDAGTTGATGELTLWLDGTQLTDIAGMSIRSTTALKIENLWLSLYHHDGTHSTQGMLFDNVVVGTQRISCGSGGTDTTPPAAPTGLSAQ